MIVTPVEVCCLRDYLASNKAKHQNVFKKKDLNSKNFDEKIHFIKSRKQYQ